MASPVIPAPTIATLRGGLCVERDVLMSRVWSVAGPVVMGAAVQSSRVALCSAHNDSMSSASDMAAALGSPLLQVIAGEANVAEVGDVVIAEPGDTAPGGPGDLVLGVGARDVDHAERLVRCCAQRCASGVILRSGVAEEQRVVETAQRVGIALLSLGEEIAWAHLVWLLRGLVDPAVAPSGAVDGDPAPERGYDLFALADTVAAIVGGPVTFEDNRSRILAYSSGQAQADPARVATIVGRRVPEEVTAHFRARGVFRRLARSDEAFVVRDCPDGTRPRLVVPVWAGGQWLGSIWAMVERSVDESTTAELRRATSILALHLLRMNAGADIARSQVKELIRAALREYAPERPLARVLPGRGPWRVVALRASGSRGVEEHVQMWATTLRRHGWRQAVVADLDGTVFAVVADDNSGSTEPGTWAWLGALVRDLASSDALGWSAAAGTPAMVPELPRSRVEGAEALKVGQAGLVESPAVAVEDEWDAIGLGRVLATVDLMAPGSPLRVLLDHDADNGTSYAPTLSAWLKHYGEPGRAARSLVIHPNTLRYRMSRLHRLVTLDLDDPQQRLVLQLQIESRRFLNH
ncbi:DNA-binding transcriptional regulator, PucR family [Ruania alba]|uniref:DNA-binding transcriptional regulator, PucR family n=2 Tax=Ruania alba TaxID=648782 RepID=A0A1H5N1G5_9MICO|nr:DNA-binding transcriptional regulator, PucR family [Ruania alba]